MTYLPRSTPRAHQVEAQRRLSERPEAFALLCEMGTGKSKMVLDEFGTREAAGSLQDLLIIAPAGSYLNWCEDKSDIQPSQFKAHLSVDLFKRLAYAPWVSGGNAKELHRVDAVLATRPHPRALVVNIEALSSVKAAKAACTAFLSVPGRRAMVAVDESTTIKNRKAERTDVVTDLGRMDSVVARRILTGLVTPRSPLDLFSQFWFLDWRILNQRSYQGFQNRYAITRKMTVSGRTFNVVVGYRNTEELQQLIAPYSYRVLKEDCLDLPPKIYETRKVTLTDEQKRIYNEIKLYATAHIAGSAHVTATEVITQILRLHQLVCGFTVDEMGNHHDIKSRRLGALMEVLEEHAGKVIIWATYKPAVDAIVDRITKEYDPENYDRGQPSPIVAQFTGDNKATRGEDERRFLSDPACRFMVATQAAGGRGNTWVVANLVVYYANNYDLELRLQSEDRSHRDGLTHPVTYVDLTTEGTVDETIIKALRNKINLSTAITGDTYKEWLI